MSPFRLFTLVLLVYSTLYNSIQAQSIDRSDGLMLNIACDGELSNRVEPEMDFDARQITYTVDRYGNEDGAMYFDGEQSEVMVPIDINPKQLPEMTFLLWAKTDKTKQPGTLFSQDNGDYDRTLVIDNRAGGGWTWSAFCGSNGVIGGKQVRSDSWTFLALTYDQKKEEVQLFVNGDWFKKEGSLGPGWEYFKLGNNPSFFAPFRGSMDDIRLYDRRLDRNIIQAIYEQEKEGVYIPDWERQEEITSAHPHADYLVRVGDIDNLGFGWPSGFNPFSGRSTEPHKYPFQPEPEDYPGTDRIMVGSSYHEETSNGTDGYTKDTDRPENRPIPIELEYSAPDFEIEAVVLQLFIDDFQSAVFGSSFQVKLDGERIHYLENILNDIEQTGPVGKLITVALLPQHYHLVGDGYVELFVDDPVTGAGDGFAFDFVQLLFNPREYPYKGTIKGQVLDDGGDPISKALVSAGNIRQALTDVSGYFSLKDVPAGLANITARKSGYEPDHRTLDLLNGQEKQVELVLNKRKTESSEYILERLETKGKTDLYGIYFETDEHEPKSGSKATLKELLEVLQDKSDLRLIIAGHTDSAGSKEYNRKLSLRRAESVISWLTERGIKGDRLRARGYGESSPVASNATPEGKAQNRRVEVRVLK